MVDREIHLSKQFSDALLGAGKDAAEAVEYFFEEWAKVCDSVAREINAQFAREPHASLNTRGKRYLNHVVRTK